MKQFLAIHLQEEDLTKLQTLAARFKGKVTAIEPRDYNQLVRDLLKGFRNPLLRPYQGGTPDGSMILIDGFSDKKLYELLLKIKQADIHADFKAIVTPSNKQWNIIKLYGHMEQEKAFQEIR